MSNVCLPTLRQPTYGGEEDDSSRNYLLKAPKAVKIVVTSPKSIVSLCSSGWITSSFLEL